MDNFAYRLIQESVEKVVAWDMARRTMPRVLSGGGGAQDPREVFLAAIQGITSAELEAAMRFICMALIKKR